MTDSPAAIPAGWYADATIPGMMRWWDGAAWTAHTAPAGGAGGAASAARQVLPLDRPVYSPFIWVIVLLPLVTYALLFTWQPDFAALNRSARAGSSGVTVMYGSILTPGYFLIIASSWLLYAAIVVLAARDRAWLERQGVVRPFHWAWAFLGGLVYVIGRTVIVRRVAAPRGLTPIWVLIGVFVLGFIVSIAWTVLLTSQVITQLPATGA